MGQEERVMGRANIYLKPTLLDGGISHLPIYQYNNDNNNTIIKNPEGDKSEGQPFVYLKKHIV